MIPEQSKLFLPITMLALAGVFVFFAFPFDLGFATRVVIMIIFVLSLDLILGVAGIATLGQAAMYGVGAYAAGLYAVHITGEPLTGLLVGAVTGALVALLSGLVLMRSHGLTLIMLTVAVAQVLHEIANKAQPITGGADGLRGIRMDPILGTFEFDFVGQVGFIYASVVLILIVVFLQILYASPFGLMARGIHESPVRMRAIGAPVRDRLVIIYTIGGAIAGVAGALSAQITELVSLEVFAFALSAEAVIMLILGGMGRIYGAVLGTALFMLVHHKAAAIDPFNWLFIIGALVLIVVFFVPRGLLSVPTVLKRLTMRAS
jgi:branched-chain amino acid transport system permease protein